MLASSTKVEIHICTKDEICCFDAQYTNTFEGIMAVEFHLSRLFIIQESLQINRCLSFTVVICSAVVRHLRFSSDKVTLHRTLEHTISFPYKKKVAKR